MKKTISGRLVQYDTSTGETVNETFVTVRHCSGEEEPCLEIMSPNWQGLALYIDVEDLNKIL